MKKMENLLSKRNKKSPILSVKNIGEIHYNKYLATLLYCINSKKSIFLGGKFYEQSNIFGCGRNQNQNRKRKKSNDSLRVRNIRQL